MIPAKMQQAFNEQIHAELESAYLYLAMAGYFESLTLPGMAHWMEIQATEELAHAMRFNHHITERGGTVALQALKAPKATWASPLQAWREAYKHEQYITGRIHALVDLATKTGDHAAGPMLQWFVGEQIEEEASASRIAGTLERLGDSGNGLVMLDRELAARPAPAATASTAPAK
jgi:ferritin